MTSLESVSGGTQLTVIPEYMFCNSNLPDFNFSPDLKEIGKLAFYGCEFHKNLSLPDNVILVEGAFKRSGLTGITLGDNVSVGPEAFRENLLVDFIELGRGCKLDSCSFGPNYLVKELSIPEGTTLGTASFNAFVGLESVRIADDVIFAGEKCFTYRFNNPSGAMPHEFYETEPKPLTVYYHTATPQYTEADQFEDLTYEEGCLYVYPEGLEAARNTHPWSKFRTILPMDLEVGVRLVEPAADINADKGAGVYTLDGTPVGKTTEGLAPGLYIVREGARSRKVTVR